MNGGRRPCCASPISKWICSTRSVTRGGKAIELQPREFKLLECLMRNAGRVVTRTMLLEMVWDFHFDPEDQHRRDAYEPAARQGRPRLRLRAHSYGSRRGIFAPCTRLELSAPPRSGWRRCMWLLFATSVAVLGVIVYLATAATLDRRLDTRIAGEMTALKSAFQAGGLARLEAEVRTHQRTQPAGPLDYLVDRFGRRAAGRRSADRARADRLVQHQEQGERRRHQPSPRPRCRACRRRAARHRRRSRADRRTRRRDL